MKVHSFVRENINKCIQHKLELACQGVSLLAFMAKTLFI